MKAVCDGKAMQTQLKGDMGLSIFKISWSKGKSQVPIVHAHLGFSKMSLIFNMPDCAIKSL
jgi:hypothetical protein